MKKSSPNPSASGSRLSCSGVRSSTQRFERGNLSRMDSTILSVNRTLRPAQEDSKFKVLLTNCDYLQAMLKLKIVKDSSIKNRKELEEQLQFQKASLAKTEEKLSQVYKEMKDLDCRKKAVVITSSLQNQLESFSKLDKKIKLEEVLNQLVLDLDRLLCSVCSDEHVKISPEIFSQLETDLVKALEAFKKLQLVRKNPEELEVISELIKKVEECQQSLVQDQDEINKEQADLFLALFQFASDLLSWQEMNS